VIRTTVLVIATILGSCASAYAQEAWESGLNVRDLERHSAAVDDSAVMADVCASSLSTMSGLMQKEADFMRQPLAKLTTSSLSGIGNAWIKIGAKRRGVDVEAYKTTYLAPASGLMLQLQVQDLNYWIEHCLSLTKRLVEQRSE
jgi:hypothetical protein